MIVGFTGTRFGMTEYQKEEITKALQQSPPTLAIHGGCVGADADFHELCEREGVPIEIFPGHSASDPTDHTLQAPNLKAIRVHESQGHLKRNRDIVERSDVMWACPAPGSPSKGGTAYTMKYARIKCVPLRVFAREPKN